MMRIRIFLITTTVCLLSFLQCGKGGEYVFEDTDTKCKDGEDNDKDGYIDCEDQDCMQAEPCEQSDASNDGSDGSTSIKMPPGSLPGASDDAGMDVCDEQGFVIDPKQTTVMLLIDYSSSMTVYPEDPPNRWSQAVAALTTLLRSVSNPYVSFGLDYFPDGSDERIADGKSGVCGVKRPVQIDCAPDNEKAIIEHLTNTKAPPKSGFMTPMWCALNNFKKNKYAPGCTSGDVDPYVVVISDGSDTCGQDCHCMDTPDTCGDPEYGASAPDLAALTNSLREDDIKTFVISFGDGADYDKLNAIAEKGGTVLDSYLDAANEDELLEAFDKILEAIIPCEYEIAEPDEEKTDPRLVNFYFDEEPVPGIVDGSCSTSDGWEWTNAEQTEMRFCGDFCKQLKGGKVKEVIAKYGCRTVVY